MHPHLKKDTALLRYFLSEQKPLNYSQCVLKEHPKLIFFRKLKSRKGNFFIESYVRNFYRESKTKLHKKRELFQKRWDKINDQFMCLTSRLLQTDWPKRELRSWLTICPISTRHLKEWSFTLFFKEQIGQAMAIAAHEALHLLYFKKWTEVFPGSDPKTFEFPHLSWYLSELVAPILLDRSEIRRIVPYRIKKKTSFVYTNLAKKGILRSLKFLYVKLLEKNMAFSDFLQKANENLKKEYERGNISKYIKI